MLPVVAVVAACGGDTAILIEVTRDSSLGDRPIATLEFVAARQLPAAPGQPTTFADADPVGRIDVSERDLLADPYRMLLRPSGGQVVGAPVAIAVRALGGDGEPVAAAAMSRTVTFVSGKVLRYELVLRDSDLSWPDDCTVIFVDGMPIQIGRPPDADCDGYDAGDDCDDLDPSRNPGAHESCTDGVDNDCDSATDEESDDDGDSFTNCNGDCNDRRSEVFPGADEVCDGLDNDCNGDCDSEHDADGDGFTTCGTFLVDRAAGLCSFSDRDDCDDGDPEVSPGATERCDGLDNDCSGACEDASFDQLDPDGDTFTHCGSVIGLCGLDPAAVDCRTDNSDVSPTQTELCNGFDDNCDEQLAGRDFCLLGGEGQCRLGERTCQDSDAGWGACADLAEASPTIPDVACAKFADCEPSSGQLDPLACAIDQLPKHLHCKLHYVHPTGGDPALCPGPIALLPSIPVSGGDCEWTVLGGADQTGYRVGLTPDIQISGLPVLVDCAPQLVVEAIAPGYPHDDRVLLAVGVPAGEVTELVGVFLNPVPVEDCDNVTPLECAP